MWSLASNAVTGSMGRRKSLPEPSQGVPDCSDDEASSCIGREGLECPICFESFNIVENVPYVLWCGHTLCKNCVLGLQRAIVKLPNLPIQLPFFISCPWCHLLSLRLLYKGDLRFPRKNFFLLWMVESMNGAPERSYSATGNDGHHQHPNIRRVPRCLNPDRTSVSSAERIQSSLRQSLAFFAKLPSKLPLVIVFLIMLYAVPASAAILVLYILTTVFFALPSMLVLYFAYPSLDWLVREIMN